MDIAIYPKLFVEEMNEIAIQVRQQRLNILKYLSAAAIHVNPVNASNEKYHCILIINMEMPYNSHKYKNIIIIWLKITEFNEKDKNI